MYHRGTKIGENMVDTLQYLETLEVSENGNKILPVTVSSVEYNSQGGYITIMGFNENLDDGFGDTVKINISNKQRDGENFIETPESIKRCDDICELLFGKTYLELGDDLESIVDTEINVYARYDEATCSVRAFINDIANNTFTTYEKLKKELKGTKTYKVTRVYKDSSAYVVEIDVDGQLYGKKFRHSAFKTNKPDSTERAKAFAQLLTLFGTIEPTITENSCVDVTYATVPKTGTIYLNIVDTKGHEKDVAAYNEYCNNLVGNVTPRDNRVFITEHLGLSPR